MCSEVAHVAGCIAGQGHGRILAKVLAGGPDCGHGPDAGLIMALIYGPDYGFGSGRDSDCRFRYGYCYDCGQLDSTDSYAQLTL